MSTNRFKEALLEKKEFVYTLELVPGRGARGKVFATFLEILSKIELVNIEAFWHLANVICGKDVIRDFLDEDYLSADKNMRHIIPVSILKFHFEGVEYSYVSFFEGFRHCTDKYEKEDIVETIQELFLKDGSASFVSNCIYDSAETHVVVFNDCLSKEILEKKKRRSLEVAKSVVAEYISPPTSNRRKDDVKEASSKEELWEAIQAVTVDFQEQNIVKDRARKMSLENHSDSEYGRSPI